MYYGAIDKYEVFKMIIKVCDVFGYGANNNADKLISGTIAVETDYGLSKDNTEYSGAGLCQFDKEPFEDIQRRIVTYHNGDWCQSAKKNFDIDLSQVTWQSLKYSPLVSIIFCRLTYKLRPEPIPISIEEMGEYWKKWYNSELGKGTVKKFIEKYEKHIGG